MEDLLASVEDESQDTLFRELLAVELSHRSRLGETPDPGEYITRFPQFRSEVDSQFSRIPFSLDADSRKETLDSTIALESNKRPSADASLR